MKEVAVKMSDSCKSPTPVVILVLLLAFAASMANCAREVQSVDIRNQIPEPVFVQCESANDDLGPHTLSYGQHYFWSFHSNVWGTTLYHCNFHWGRDTKAFRCGRTLECGATDTNIAVTASGLCGQTDSIAQMRTQAAPAPKRLCTPGSIESTM